MEDVLSLCPQSEGPRLQWVPATGQEVTAKVVTRVARTCHPAAVAPALATKLNLKVTALVFAAQSRPRNAQAASLTAEGGAALSAGTSRALAAVPAFRGQTPAADAEADARDLQLS
eukprot:1635008-Rhodomonas_salina.1